MVTIIHRHSVQHLQWITEVRTSERQGHRLMSSKILSYYYLQDSREPWTVKWNGYVHLVLELRSRQNQSPMKKRRPALGEGFLGRHKPSTTPRHNAFPLWSPLCSSEGWRASQSPAVTVGVGVPKNGHAHLIYTENYSKNNQGGLLHCNVKT